jgi:hypothetical protein
MTIEASIELIGYALAKQLPDIETRAVFETNYGTLVLDHEESRKVGALVKRLLQRKLTRLNGRKTRLQSASGLLPGNRG